MRHPFLPVLIAFTLVLAAGRAADTPPVTAPVPAAAAPVPGVQKSVFGTMADGTEVLMFTLTNHHGFTAKIITYGATIAELDVPDRDGKAVSVVKGAATFAAYLRGFQNPGAASIMGRVANRIGGAKFTLDGKEYALADNANGNSIHGGKVGFDKKNWTAEVPDSPDGPAVKLSYVSKDGGRIIPAPSQAGSPTR
jgi:aldose 1-epimerase